MGSLAKLFDEQGGAIANPSVIEAAISWNTKDGVAQAFDGRRMVAELHGARVEWIELGGIRLTGMEPVNSQATAFRLQSWHFKP